MFERGALTRWIVPLSLCLQTTATVFAATNVEYPWTVLGDFVYMRRSLIHRHPIVADSNRVLSQCNCSGFTDLTTKRLAHDFDLEPGLRVGLMYTETPKMSFEGSFLWLDEWEGEKSVHGQQSLYYPFHDNSLTVDYVNANEAKAHYRSQFWDLEFNYWVHLVPRRREYFSLSGIAGLRYFNFRETFKLTYINPPDKSDYHIRAKDDIFGAQVGGNFQINPTRTISWDMTAKIGGMLNHGKQHTLWRDANNTVVLKHYTKQCWQTGAFADLAAQLSFQFKEHLNLHIGYQILLFSGLVLAPEQVQKRLGAGHHIYDGGRAVIQGLFAGLDIIF